MSSFLISSRLFCKCDNKDAVLPQLVSKWLLLPGLEKPCVSTTSAAEALAEPMGFSARQV